MPRDITAVNASNANFAPSNIIATTYNQVAPRKKRP